VTERGLAPTDLLNRGLTTLGQILGPGWKVTQLQDPPGVRPTSGDVIDARVQIEGSGGVFVHVLVNLKEQLTPRAVDQQLLPVLSVLRHAQAREILLVIAPWIAPRTQEHLRKHGIGYIDLTGNADLRVSQPAIVVHTEGATRAPRSPGRPSTTSLAGPKAGRLVRLLADFEPPYRAVDVAAATGLSPAYISRLLDQLEDQLLIRREGKVITAVDWVELLRARAATYDLLRHNPYVAMIAPNGISAVLDRLRTVSLPNLAVTGPVAARAVAPLTVGGQLMLYVESARHSPDHVGDELGLISFSDGADVLVLRAHDNVVFDRMRVVDGIPHVALSQLVLDSLAGPGRMPAEAEAVLTYMSGHTNEWRRPKLPRP
jgi:hypothetical protein